MKNKIRGNIKVFLKTKKKYKLIKISVRKKWRRTRKSLSWYIKNKEKKKLNRYYMRWKWNKTIRNINKRFLLISFLLFVILTMIIHHFIPYNNYDLSRLADYFFYIQYIRDTTVIKSITTVTSSFTILISLLSAIYVFTYREQKSVSPSGSTDIFKNTLVSVVIILMIINLTFAWLLSNDYNRFLNETSYSSSLNVTEYLFWKVLFMILMFMFLLSQVIKLIKYLFGTMSVDKMLSDSVKQTFRIFNKIDNSYRLKKFDNLLDEDYKKFHFSIESVFQNLKFAADNNMNKELEENVKEFEKIFALFKHEVVVHNGKIHKSTYLLEKDNERFSLLYQSAIRCTLSLIAYLFKNQQYNKARTLVLLYIKMYNDYDVSLNKIYKKSLIEFLDIIDVNDERQISIYLEGLEKLPEHKILIAYNFLLMKLINKNQLKNLTNVVYAFKNNIKNIKMYKMSIVIILLQNIVKSFEISNSEITGFLVKFLFTNFSGKEISRGLKSLKRNPKAFTTVLEDDEKIQGINEEESYAIVINEETFDYCYKKAYILLYAQHLFSIQENLWYVRKEETGSEIELSKEFATCNYSEYILMKILAGSSKYGLLFFEDKTVMRSVHKELNLKYPEPPKNENNISDTAQLLVRKLFKLDEVSTEVK